jgi:hypothetical protein
VYRWWPGNGDRVRKNVVIHRREAKAAEKTEKDHRGLV